MKRNSDVLAVGCVLAVAIGAGAWHYANQQEPAHLLVGIDPSLSVEPNCGGVRGAARALLDRKEIRQGSTLTVLAMGVSPLDPDPELRFNAPIPITDDSVYGRPEHEKEYQEALDALLGGFERACEEIEATKHTPLYQLVEQGLAHLRSNGLKWTADDRCFFLIKSDLLEDVHPGLRSVLKKASDDPAASVPIELARSLDNAGVEISFCGTVEIRPPAKKASSPPSLETRKRIWRELFTHPELVSFQPFCLASTAAR